MRHSFGDFEAEFDTFPPHMQHLWMVRWLLFYPGTDRLVANGEVRERATPEEAQAIAQRLAQRAAIEMAPGAMVEPFNSSGD